MLRGPYNRNFVYFCLSTDTKPTYNIEGGSELFETDTNFSYMFDGSAWQRVAVDTDVTSSVLPSGAATSAKQLADGHNVNVSNIANTPVITGFATSVKQLGDNHNVTVSNIANTPVITGFATSANQGKFSGAVSGLSAWKEVDGKPRVSSMPYLYDIAEGNVSGHAAWTKIGFNPALTTEEDIWSAGGSYVFPTGATAMAVIGGATDDGSPAIFSGTATAGSTTSLTDTAKDFTGGTAVVAGDCVVLDKAGTTPEWGYVTALVGTDTLTIAGGFSSGGTANGRTYDIVDKSLSVGAQVVKIEYLDTAYAQKSEIVILNGAAEVNLTNSPFRINSFRVIATGSSNTSSAIGLTLKAQTPTATIYSYITGGFTRARNSVYTVPVGKTLYVTQFSASYGTTGNPNKEYARIYTRANRESATGFLTGGLFYPYTELVVQNNTAVVTLCVPTKLTAMTDLKISAVATAAGAVSTVLRGWLE